MSTLVVAERPYQSLAEAARARRLPQLAAVAVQIALALLVIRQFRLESRSFFLVMLLAGAGAVAHAVLPMRLRLAAFAALSTGAVVLVLGIKDALWVLGVAGALVGLCHLPIRWSLRVALLVAAGAGLAASRRGGVPVPWGGVAWAVLGSMLMFRLAVYLYALKHDPVRPTAAQTAAYFLMLPNPVFPLFPVVDYGTFMRSHYAKGVDEMETYRSGAAWVARGLVQLLIYRVVYHQLPEQPLKLASLGALLWYVLGTFLLYLRVSGQFHIIAGVLRLYGFALPETHKLYFLSSSFTDFWRRINIYWKDFMMKLVYFPSFFRLRRWGGTRALVLSTALVFAVTWFLHAYQWFWLLGVFPRSLPDLTFWTILGLLVIAQSLREERRGRDRSLGARRWSAKLAVRVVATFCGLAVLWSLWSAESLVEWAWMWRAAVHIGPADAALVLALLALGVGLGGRNWTAPRLAAAGTTPWWGRTDVRTVATLGALLALGQPGAADLLGPAGFVVETMHRTTLNAQDAAVERRGYYEGLDRGPRLGAQGWETRAERPADWLGPAAAGVIRQRHDFARYALLPSNRVTYLRAPLTTNAWGMRDAPRDRAKPTGTVRLAVFGPSFVMGSGVSDSLTFPAILERNLRAAPPPNSAVSYEVLNFGVTGHSLLQELDRFETLGLRFAPDVAVFTTFASIGDQTATHLAIALRNGWQIPYPGLDSLLRRWHASPALPWPELTGVLRVAMDDVQAWALHRMAEDCRARGITPVLVGLNVVGPQHNLDAATRRVAEREGFVVLDLDDVYGPESGWPALQIAEWDNHPNAEAMRLIADRLHRELLARPAILRAAPPSRAETAQ